MLKKLIDTNIFIDRFANPEMFREIFNSEGVVVLSAVVLMELRAGAHDRQALKAVHQLYYFFRKTDRVVVPSAADYEKSGMIIAQLQKAKGYEAGKSASITNDCLIAASAKSAGAAIYTRNRKDFEAIKSVFDCRVEFV